MYGIVTLRTSIFLQFFSLQRWKYTM